jgi:hypothetical protein
MSLYRPWRNQTPDRPARSTVTILTELPLLLLITRTVNIFGRSLIRSQLVSLEFFIDISFWSNYGPWGRLSLQQKWVPGAFPRGKGGRCVRLTTYYHPVPWSRNLGTFSNPLGPAGPVTGLLYLYLTRFEQSCAHPQDIWYNHPELVSALIITRTPFIRSVISIFTECDKQYTVNTHERQVA